MQGHVLYPIWLREHGVFCAIHFFLPFENQPIVTLEGSISYMFLREGMNKVTVQVASGSTIMQDTKVITVKGEWEKLSSNAFNWNPVHCMNMQYAI